MAQAYQLKVTDWAAWSPQFPDSEHWQNWPEFSDENLYQPKSVQVPAMMRRRCSRLSKMALETANQILSEIPQIHYGIFCSRHGELHRTLALLQSIVEQDALSPTLFAQSVHNTASGLFGIANQNTMPTTSIAATARMVEQAWLEAWAYLEQNPHHKVLLVAFDETIPEPYQAFVSHEDDISIALCLQHSSSESGQSIRYRPQPLETQSRHCSSPWAFIKWFLSDADSDCWSRG